MEIPRAHKGAAPELQPTGSLSGESVDQPALGAEILLLPLIGLVTPLRATEREEALGTDVVQHGENAYVTGEGAILVSTEARFEAEVPVADPR